jgi:transposase
MESKETGRQSVLKENYYTELTEVDKLVFEKLIPADHYLRRVKEVINFEAFREQVKDCYSPTMGRSAEDPVRLIKLEFLQFHYNLSDREVMAEAQVNVAFRYFLDLSLDSALLVPSLLAQFRARLGWERHQRLFDEVVAQARQHGLVKDKRRLKDAIHIIANIAVPSTIQLVAQARSRFLESAQVDADIREHQPKADQIRETTRGWKDAERLLHRVTHLQEIVHWADQPQARLGASTASDKARERFDQALALAHQVLADRAASGKELPQGSAKNRLVHEKTSGICLHKPTF